MRSVRGVSHRSWDVNRFHDPIDHLIAGHTVGQRLEGQDHTVPEHFVTIIFTSSGMT